MKRLVAVVLILCPMVALGQAGAAATESPLTVHVVSSKIVASPGYCSKTASGVVMLNLLRVAIRGKKYELAVPIPGRLFPHGLFDGSRPILIAPGDYPASVAEDRQPNPGEIQRVYGLRLSNGKTVQAYLWGMRE